jgi:hypothetical protein
MNLYSLKLKSEIKYKIWIALRMTEWTRKVFIWTDVEDVSQAMSAARFYMKRLCELFFSFLALYVIEFFGKNLLL